MGRSPSATSGLLRYVPAATLARGADAGAAVGLLLVCVDRADRVGQPLLAGGLLGAALTAPHLLGPLLARRLDRAADPRPALAGACVGYAVALALAALLVGRAPLGVVAAVVTTAGLCGPLLTGGLSSVLAAVISASGTDPRRAEGWDALTYGLGGSLGPAAVAALAAATSPTGAVVGLATGAGLGGAVLLTLPRPRVQSRAGEPGPSTGSVLRSLVVPGPLRRVTGATAVTAVALGAVPVLAVLLAADLHAADPGGPLLTTVLGVGTLVGSLVVTARPLRGDPERLTVRWVAVIGAGFAACAAAPGFAAALVGFFAVGAANAPFFAATLAARSAYSAPAARARTFVAVAAVKVAAMAAGTVLAGLLSREPPRLLLLAAGAVVALSALAMALQQRTAVNAAAGPPATR